jgi:hypothetical protein
MSLRLMSAVFERSKTKGNARLVLLALADACGDQGDCWPSVRSIAKKANVSPIIARKYINALVDVGVLIKEHSGDYSGRQTSNSYTLIEDKIGDDFISKEQLHLAMSPSRVKTKDMVTRVNTPDGNPGYQGEGVTGVNRAYMNHHKEPPVEPSSDFAIAPSESGGECTQDLLLPDDVAGSPAAPSPRKRKPKKVDDQFIAKLKTLNPTIDIDAELRKMDTWLLGHPERRKTRPFVANWINREAAEQAAKNNKDNTPRLPNGEIDWANVKPNE